MALLLRSELVTIISKIEYHKLFLILIMITVS